jgi:hypothetical protein
LEALTTDPAHYTSGKAKESRYPSRRNDSSHAKLANDEKKFGGVLEEAPHTQNSSTLQSKADKDLPTQTSAHINDNPKNREPQTSNTVTT